MNELPSEIAKNLSKWETWINSKDVHLTNPPSPYACGQDNDKSLSLFQRLLLLKTVREEKTLYAMTYYVE